MTIEEIQVDYLLKNVLHAPLRQSREYSSDYAVDTKKILDLPSQRVYSHKETVSVTLTRKDVVDLIKMLQGLQRRLKELTE
jgi:hypothetical protein